MSIVKYSSARLNLREATAEDDTFFFELLNSPNWIEHIGDRNISSTKDAQAYIEKSLITSYQKNGFGLYVMELKSNLQPIGICGLVDRPSLDFPDIGFAILPDFERQGYTMEAAEATMGFAKQMKVEKILAITSPSNLGSQKIIKNLGLKLVGNLDGDARTLLFEN